MDVRSQLPFEIALLNLFQEMSREAAPTQSLWPRPYSYKGRSPQPRLGLRVCRLSKAAPVASLSVPGVYRSRFGLRESSAPRARVLQSPESTQVCRRFPQCSTGQQAQAVPLASLAGKYWCLERSRRMATASLWSRQALYKYRRHPSRAAARRTRGSPLLGGMYRERLFGHPEALSVRLQRPITRG